MKEYVLDEPPSPDAPPPDATSPDTPPYVRAATLPPQPWPWRALLVLALVEPLALGALYLALNADAHPRRRAESLGPATIAAFTLPSAPGPSAAGPATAADAFAQSRIAFERGKYVIDLRSTDSGPALAMLAQATKATVHGADALAREPTRLSRSAVVATPAEAWQTVFGDIANFAISCTPKGCAVFVAAVAKGDAKADARPATLALATPALAPPGADGAEMPAVDPVAAAAALAATTFVNGALPPGAVQAPENSGSEN